MIPSIIIFTLIVGWIIFCIKTDPADYTPIDPKRYAELAAKLQAHREKKRQKYLKKD